MSSILEIQFPKDFESKYLAYKASILGNTQETAVEDAPRAPTPPKSYTGVQEPIHLKALGIEISGRYITKGANKTRINSTERSLIYFLYYKYLENSDECFTRSRLASEPEFEDGAKAEGYIKNSIANINKIVRELVVKGKTSLGDFIKYESDRGYRLNSKFMP